MIIENETRPKRRIRTCVMCTKKRNLLFYATTQQLVLQICNKCLDALAVDKDNAKGVQDE